MNSFLVEISNADVYIGEKKILSAINWTMMKDQNWAIVGNNGSGKTTLMKVIFGDLLPIYGEGVNWFGSREWTGLAEIREKVSLVSAEYQANYDKNIIGLDVVVSGFFSTIGLYEHVASKQIQEGMEWMDFLGITHLAKKYFHQMSYGEARRVILARALVNHPLLLVLDEPCSGLDIPTREIFLETLEKLAGKNTPAKNRANLIYVTHRIEEIIPAITHTLYMKGGQVIDQGTKGDMLTDNKLSKALGCDVTLKENDDRFWVTGCRTKVDQKTGFAILSKKRLSSTHIH
jgi:iron complex transport system ATP-binding protein